MEEQLPTLPPIEDEPTKPAYLTFRRIKTDTPAQSDTSSPTAPMQLLESPSFNRPKHHLTPRKIDLDNGDLL